MDMRNYGDRTQGVLPGESVLWPVCWSAVWVGALAALAVALVTSLIGVVIGAEIVGHGESIRSWRAGHVHFWGIAWAVLSAFFSFVVGGWVAARITGHPRSEPAMLHGAIVWLVAIPLLMTFAALGAGGYFGYWYTGLAGSPAWVNHPPIVDVTEAAAIARNNALGALTALLLGLIGSVLGGWMASGEPMSIFHYRTRDTALATARTTSSQPTTV